MTNQKLHFKLGDKVRNVTNNSQPMSLVGFDHTIQAIICEWYNEITQKFERGTFAPELLVRYYSNKIGVGECV